MTSDLPATRWTYAGLFLVALATLMYEILLTRIFSVTMWYHFAFVAISIAMFGMTVGALLVYLSPQRYRPADVKRQLARAAVLFPIGIVFSFFTVLSIPFRVHPSVIAAYAIGLTYAVLTVPFVLSGICMCLALTRFSRHVGQLYAADLAGAALGCVLLIYTLSLTDGPTAVIVVAFLASLGGVSLAIDAGRRWPVRRAVFLALVLGLFAGGHTVMVWKEHPILRILYVKAEFEARPLYEKWNSYSRVRVNGNPSWAEKPYAWGLSSLYPSDRLVNQLHMDIDVAAGTVLTKWTGDRREVEHLKYDVTNIAYYLRPHANALVVGTGGGRDILSALAFDVGSVVGVELNNDIIDTVNRRFGEFTGHLDRDPRVRFVNDEARTYVARQNTRYDLIQISLIDTWAATAAGAFILSENSLYTVEAWTTFLAHLSDRGLLSVSRWYFRDRPGEVYRLTALAGASLRKLGFTDPRSHIVIIRNMRLANPRETPDGIGTILVNRSPFTAEELDRLQAIAAQLRFEIVLSPTYARDTIFAGLASGDQIDRIAGRFPVNIAPPTDDSPFFFHMLRLRDLFKLDLLKMGKQTPNMEAVFVLGTLLLTVTLLTVLCIIVPLVMTSGKASLEGSAPLLVFFAAIGLGFMLIETSQMQRLIVALGHPTYGLSVVLFALLLSSGAGSYSTAWIDGEVAGRAGTVRLASLLGLLVVFGLVTPGLLRISEGLTISARILVAVAILFPPGFLMGMAFPLGMKIASREAPALTPWLWGINGATSVYASVLAVAIALSSTISAAFWTGAVCYGLALAAFVWASRRLARKTVSIRLAEQPARVSASG